MSPVGVGGRVVTTYGFHVTTNLSSYGCKLTPRVFLELSFSRAEHAVVYQLAVDAEADQWVMQRCQPHWLSRLVKTPTGPHSNDAGIMRSKFVKRDLQPVYPERYTVGLVLEFFQEITGIINLLDPEGTGVISFDDFCEGVKQLAAIQVQVHSPDPSLHGSCSIETLVPCRNISPGLSVSEKIPDDSDSRHTFGEYDISRFEDIKGTSLVDSCDLSEVTSHLILRTSEDEGDSAFSGKSSEINENSRHEVTDEENFEDFGESEADASDPGLFSTGTLRESQDRKTERNLISRPHKRTCPNRRLTSATYARQLQRDCNSPGSTRRGSFGSDTVYDDIDGNFQNIDDRMKYLESQILKLSDSQANTHSSLRKENSSLKSKVHDLETQLQLMEVRTEEKLNEEQKKHEEYINRQKRELKDQQMDYVTYRLQKMEEENEALKQEVPRIRTELHQVRTEKLNLQDAFDTLNDEHHKMQTEFHKSKKHWERERETTGQLLDELGKELEELRRYKIDHETFHGSRKSSFGDLPAQYQDLQLELQKLREENKMLKDSNEDLNAQLLTRCMEEGRSLLRDTNGTSLAEELEHLTKEELLERLKKEQEINLRLKQYVDKIILTIIEKNPSLLEIAK